MSTEPPPPPLLLRDPPPPQAPTATVAAATAHAAKAFVNTIVLLIYLDISGISAAPRGAYLRWPVRGARDSGHHGRMDEPASARWATFDCYGTLVDWNRGIGDELERLFGADARDELLARYHEIEPQVQVAAPQAPYREVLARTLAGCAKAAGRELPADEAHALALSLPDWPVFEEVPAALAAARG